LNTSKSKAVLFLNWLVETRLRLKVKQSLTKFLSKRESVRNCSRTWWTNTACSSLNGRSSLFLRSLTLHLLTCTMSLKDIT